MEGPMPFLVLYVILVLLTPIPVIYLLVKHRQLFEQATKLKADAENQIAALERQVAELNRRVQALQSGAAPEAPARSESRAASPTPEALGDPVIPPKTPPPSVAPSPEIGRAHV